jgi:hypothetical protein
MRSALAAAAQSTDSMKQDRSNTTTWARIRPKKDNMGDEMKAKKGKKAQEEQNEEERHEKRRYQKRRQHIHDDMKNDSMKQN